MFFHKKYLYSAIFDLLYYSILVFLVSFYLYRVLPKLQIMQQAAPLIQEVATATISPEIMQQISDIESAMFQFKFYSVIIIIALFLNYCFFKYLVWRFLLNKKLAAKSFGKFCVLNIIISLIFIATIFITYFVSKTNIFPVILIFIILPLTIHFINIFHPVFNIKENLVKTFKTSLEKSVLKFFHFIIPYIIMLAILFIIMQIMAIPTFLPDKVYTLLYGFIIVLYITWTKVYILEILKKLNVKK